jgi:DNA-binding beta-propeller fold protein YncE
VIDINPNGKTAYVTGIFSDAITPISIATNTPGKPIHVPIAFFPAVIVFTPDGKTAYIPTAGDTITPINTATNTPGKPIRVGTGVDQIAITPDGKTLYAAGVPRADQHRHQHPRPIRTPPRRRIAITPDGKTVYVAASSRSRRSAPPRSTPGKPIRIGRPVLDIAITPDGKTVYVANPEGPPGAVTPISTATNTPGKPIRIGNSLIIAITPNGKTLYAAAVDKVVPISTATNTPGKPIRHVGYGYPNEIVITP